MSNNLIQIIRKKFTDTLNKIRPQYNQPSFVEFLSKPVEESKEPLKEGSKIFQQFESIIDEKYREFQRTFQVDEKKIFEAIVKEPTEYIKNVQLKGDYVEFLVEYSSQNPMLRPGELREKLENSEQRPPYLWMEFQQKHLGKDLIDRLEKIRTDPQFQDYIKAKERWKEDMKSRQPPVTGDKAIDNHLKYVEILPQVHRWIMRQLYMDFRHHNQANFFKFLEKDFNDQKQLAREKVQKQQGQRTQMPQQNNPYEQQQQQQPNKQHPQQQNHYDPMKQQQPMPSHNSAYDPMKQQQPQINPQPYDSMKQNSQHMNQYDQNKYSNPYDSNKHLQQQPGHYENAKPQNQQQVNQSMQNQYSGQGQYSQYGQNQNQNNQSQNSSYQQYDSMKPQQQQYPQQNMYDSTNKMPQNMDPYGQANKQNSMNSYDPSKQYQQQGHQMNQINTHASPQLAHGGHQMNQSTMQQRGAAPNAATNRSAKMTGAHLAQGQGQNQNQGSHNYQQNSSSLPQHQNIPHNQAQISAGQSPRTLTSPGMHQGTHNQQQMMAQQQQMHNPQSGHMQQHNIQSTLQNQPSPHQNVSNPYNMNSSYNPHQNQSMTQIQHKQSKMGVPSPSQLQNQSMPSTNPSPMSHSGMPSHYGSQSSQQGRQMQGQNQNMNQSSNQYNTSMGRDNVDSLNARQSLSQQSQYSNSDSLTPRASLSQNQSQNQNMYQQNQVSNQAQQQAEAQAKARAQAEAQARAQAEAQVQARAQAEAQARAKAEAENQARIREAEQARLRAEAQAQARAKAEAENQARMRAEAEAQQARIRAEAQAQAQAQAEAQARAQAEAQAKAQAEALAAKEAALKRSQQQQQAKQAALQTPMRPHVIQKETFNLSDDFGSNLNFNDFGTGLSEVADKFRHQYGNRKVIEDFERNIRDEFYQRDESIAEMEQQAQAQKKRVKVNPSFEEELNLIPSASTSTSTKESFISPTSTAIPEPKQPVLKPVEKELHELRMDPRVKVDDRGSLATSPYIDTTFFKMNDGIISYHEKLVLKIFQDENKGIEIQEMANLQDFMSEYNEIVFFALKDAKLKTLVETWLEFCEFCASKANSKIQDLDDLFG